MEQEFLNKFNVNLEDGEISDIFDAGVFQPLPRSVSLATNAVIADNSAVNTTTTKSNNNTSMGVDDKIDILANEDTASDVSSLTDDSSDTCLKAITSDGSRTRRTKRSKRRVMVRIQPIDNAVEQRDAKFKRYRRMAAAWEDEALAENMRECDVTHHNRMRGSDIEGYDVSLHYKLNGDNCLKRCFSKAADRYSNVHQRKEQPKKKKKRISLEDGDGYKFRKPVHERIGHRQKQRSRSQSPSFINTDKSYYNPRCLEDMNDVQNRDALDVAREMADKLKENNCELVAKVIEILGVETALTFYKETQRIEADGGLEIMNGTRRRTSGGVFFTLIKRDEGISAEVKKNIFCKYEKLSNKKQKAKRNAIRNRKVEELKKRLSEQSSELALLQTHTDYVMDTVDQKAEVGNLLNPPPSPEANDSNSPAFNCININTVVMESTTNIVQDQQPSTFNADATSVSEAVIAKFDDILDIPCGDMEL